MVSCFFIISFKFVCFDREINALHVGNVDKVLVYFENDRSILFIFVFISSFLFFIYLRGEWPNASNSVRLVTEVNLGRVRSNSGWVTSEA